ncbi:hypothetical protein AB3662_06995 [Sorangium cellulosum]|uniref:hypothetical protein n=1 Tax=Sorangium cellulosum TaxID=56 RepID=UPI003D9A1F14
MANPFEKRATEYMRDSDTFLSIVTPEPLKTFLKDPAENGRLYDRLALITGTPGSGKTTIATLLQFHFVDALRRNKSRTGYNELVGALASCRAIDDDGRPLVAGVRLPLEAEYRDFWQLPYSTTTRTRLVLALLQARAVLGWLRNLTATGQFKLEEIGLLIRPGAEAAAREIGGVQPEGVRNRAADVERAVYGIGAALVPPASEADFPEAAKVAYHPFDVIEGFELRDSAGPLRVQPLVMLDDAHTLHPHQLAALNRDLARRELRIARWVLTRVDVLSPTEALLSEVAPSPGGIAGPQLGRDVTVIAMQKGEDRKAQRRAFRTMAKDMANRYLRQMPEFSRRGHDSLADLLETSPEPLSEGTHRKLSRDVDRAAKGLGIGETRRKALEDEIGHYMEGTRSRDTGMDVRLSMLSILFHRHAKRVPQRMLFEEDLDPAKPVKADAGVAEAARVHLYHNYGRPLYYGIDTVCDAASENAEQFLHLAGKLVARAENRIVRNRNAVLDSRVQHADLQAVAVKILEKYDYPFAREVRALADAIALECLERSLEPNASLDGGANAVGVPQEQFNGIATSHPRLAQVLQFAVAYNVITLAQNYGQGSKQWCLLELGGCIILKHGLTLHRGGFLERTVPAIDALLPPEDP